MDKNDILKHNEKSWNKHVEEQFRWTQPYSDNLMQYAKQGKVELFLSPNTPIPVSWCQFKDKVVLVLAGGGGQQAPLLALAGAKRVVVVDISMKQLEQDLEVSRKYNIKNLEVCNCSADKLNIDSESIDLIINPLSSCFFPDMNTVWNEVARVLKKSGKICYAFNNPIAYQFDYEKSNKGEFELKYPQPFSDIKSFSEEEKKKFLGNYTSYEFGHSLTDQIGLLLKKGFIIEDFFEDHWDSDEPINKYFPQFINVLAKKL